MADFPGMKVTALLNLSVTDMMQLYLSGVGVLSSARMKSMLIVWNGQFAGSIGCIDPFGRWRGV